jgi:hypothetical protein
MEIVILTYIWSIMFEFPDMGILRYVSFENQI